MKKENVKGLERLTAILATVLGVICIVFNLLVFVLAVPKFNSYGNFAAKISDDMEKYYVHTAEYGKLKDTVKGEGESATGTVTVFTPYINESYDDLLKGYNESFENFNRTAEEYSKAYAEYSDDTDYVVDRVGNYLDLLIALDDLQEPQEGIENYDALKKEYDEKKKEYEDKIADYEKKAAGLQENEADLNALLEDYNVYAAQCAELLVTLTDAISVNQLSDEYKAEFYADPFTGVYGLTEFLNGCKSEIDGQLQAYKTYLSAYAESVDDGKRLSEGVVIDEANKEAVANSWQSATADLEAFFTEYSVVYKERAELVKEYEGYVAGNKEQYDNVVAEQSKEETATDENELWLTNYNAEIVNYESEISAYDNSLYGFDEVISLLNLQTYSDVLVKKVETGLEIAEVNGEITEAEGDTTELEKRLETLNEELEKCEADIEKQSAVIGVYAEIMNGTVWTDDYYIAYLKNNKEDEDFSVKKSAYETVTNAAYAVGKGELKALLTDTFDYNTAVYTQGNSSYEGAVAYYATEQLTLRLQAAVNALPDLFAPVTDYYKEINSSTRIDWLYVNSEMRNRVKKDLSIDGHYEMLQTYTDGLKQTELKDTVFADYSVTATEDEVKAIEDIISALSFDSVIKDFSDITGDIKSLSDSAKQQVTDYKFAPDVLRIITLTFDIIIAVILACYFAYAVAACVADARKNGEDMTESLKD